jgi:hypothetical protein
MDERSTAGACQLVRTGFRLTRCSAGRLARTLDRRSDLGVRRQAGDEIGWVEAEAVGNLDEVVQADVALATLDLAEKGPVDADLIGHRLLA